MPVGHWLAEIDKRQSSDAHALTRIFGQHQATNVHLSFSNISSLLLTLQ